MIKIVTVPNPIAGANVDYLVTGHKYWKLVALAFQLEPDTTDSFPLVKLFVGAELINTTMSFQVAIAPNQVQCFAAIQVVGVGQDEHVQFPLPDLRIPGNGKITVGRFLGGAATAIQNVRLVIEYTDPKID